MLNHYLQNALHQLLPRPFRHFVQDQFVDVLHGPKGKAAADEAEGLAQHQHYSHVELQGLAPHLNQGHPVR